METHGFYGIFFADLVIDGNFAFFFVIRLLNNTASELCNRETARSTSGSQSSNTFAPKLELAPEFYHQLQLELSRRSLFSC